MAKAKEAGQNVTALLGNLYEGYNEEGSEALLQGLTNLNSMAKIEEAEDVAGKKYSPGVIGFRKYKSKLDITIACGTAQVRDIKLAKFISMIENLHKTDKSATIMLQNFETSDNNNPSKGQILGRINPKSSAIHIMQGLTGRIIRNPSDIALFDIYYVDRTELTSYYLAAKSQIGNEAKLEEMIATFDGWKAFEVPLDLANPYGV
ncbi:MAG: hypothetical protein PF450_14205 [Bacteroidales bacterium]|jgi:hypothetical protein|nr:hypothetical protein [Bacteroidales bacterium]